jgi:hypothetical protein
MSRFVDIWVARAPRRGKMSEKRGLFVRSRLTLKLAVVSLNYTLFDSSRAALSEYHSRIFNECVSGEKRPWAATSTLCAPILSYFVSLHFE